MHKTAFIRDFQDSKISVKLLTAPAHTYVVPTFHYED